MNDTVTIRVAGKADVPEILEVHAQPTVDAGEVLSNEAAIALLQRFEHYPNYQLYVACLGDEVVGTFALLIMDNLAHLGRPSAIVEDVAVDPHYQRRGVGRRMLEFAMDKAKESGCYKLTLSAASQRGNAHKFYESLGFERHGYSFRISLDAA
ncbi:MAG: GNAT family N-acetyltransferase [Woeseiaceae bacterium]